MRAPTHTITNLQTKNQNMQNRKFSILSRNIFLPSAAHSSGLFPASFAFLLALRYAADFLAFFCFASELLAPFPSPPEEAFDTLGCDGSSKLGSLVFLLKQFCSNYSWEFLQCPLRKVFLAFAITFCLNLPLCLSFRLILAHISFTTAASFACYPSLLLWRWIDIFGFFFNSGPICGLSFFMFAAIAPGFRLGLCLCFGWSSFCHLWPVLLWCFLFSVGCLWSVLCFAPFRWAPCFLWFWLACHLVLLCGCYAFYSANCQGLLFIIQSLYCSTGVTTSTGTLNFRWMVVTWSAVVTWWECFFSSSTASACEVIRSY